MAAVIPGSVLAEAVPRRDADKLRVRHERVAAECEAGDCPVPHVTACPALVLLALVLLAVLVGCGQERLPEGPLGKFPESQDTVGQPVPEGGADTIGFDAVFNGGPAEAVIDRLVVVSPRHIKLIGVYVTIGGIVGNWPTFPPAFPRSASGRRENRYSISRWANRHKPAGAIIPPHRWAGIALGLAATSAHGSLAGIYLFTTSAALITNGTGTCGLS